MKTWRIRRVSDRRWLGLNMGIQPKWLKDKRGAWVFEGYDKWKLDLWRRELRKELPGEEFEIIEEETT